MHAYTIVPGHVRQNEDFARPRSWPSLFVYLYMIFMGLQFIWSLGVIVGVDGIHNRAVLVLFGGLFPNVVLLGFIATLLDVGPERRYPTVNVEISVFFATGVLCGAITLALISIHILNHGSAHNLQPMEQYSDSGTSYFFVVFWILTSSMIGIWNSLGMVSGYAEDSYRPSKITLHDEFIKKCE